MMMGVLAFPKKSQHKSMMISFVWNDWKRKKKKEESEKGQ